MIEIVSAWFVEQLNKFNINEIIGSWGSGAFLAVAGAALAWLVRWIGYRIKKARIPKAKEEHYTILVACLENDTANRQRDHILNSLESLLGRDLIHILHYPEVLSISEISERGQALIDAEATGKKWLDKTGADLLVWGEVAKADAVLRLRILVTEGEASKSKGYSLTETLELPADFGEELGAALEAIIVASVTAAYDSGRYVVDILKPAHVRLRSITQNLPATFTPASRGTILHAQAVTAEKLGAQQGDNSILMEAVAAYRDALQEWPRERVPLRWATTQNNLGNALSTLGERENGTERLEQAVAAYRDALQEWTRERVPLQWAMTQNNLGTSLSKLGERENGTERLEEAVTTYRDALQEWTREQVPLDWARTQNNLGNALSKLGEREGGVT